MVVSVFKQMYELIFNYMNSYAGLIGRMLIQNTCIKIAAPKYCNQWSQYRVSSSTFPTINGTAAFDSFINTELTFCDKLKKDSNNCDIECSSIKNYEYILCAFIFEQSKNVCNQKELHLCSSTVAKFKTSIQKNSNCTLNLDFIKHNETDCIGSNTRPLLYQRYSNFTNTGQTSLNPLSVDFFAVLPWWAIIAVGVTVCVFCISCSVCIACKRARNKREHARLKLLAETQYKKRHDVPLDHQMYAIPAFYNSAKRYDGEEKKRIAGSVKVYPDQDEPDQEVSANVHVKQLRKGKRTY